MFYDKFEQLCSLKDIFPTRAVEGMGLSRTIAVKWKKTGAVPRGKTLKIIADYFGVSESYLLSDDENQFDEREHLLAELQVLKDDDDFIALNFTDNFAIFRASHFFCFRNIFNVLKRQVTPTLQMKMQTEMQTKKDRVFSPCPDFYLLSLLY